MFAFEYVVGDRRACAWIGFGDLQNLLVLLLRHTHGMPEMGELVAAIVSLLGNTHATFCSSKRRSAARIRGQKRTMTMAASRSAATVKSLPMGG